MDEEHALTELQHQVNALAAIIGVMLAAMQKDKEMITKLKRLEEELRKRNASSSSIMLVRSSWMSLED
ncbi:hypothetical protein CYG48_12750 [Neorhizobium sp. SOG26]|uniref:hypothetical protein n=1 Tax=Neorhizobium sp. SOG26 TaxID=2060726 RepID=UPI000E58E0D9|nr:hypothetical protein [Neorhizobium sp. SOG26]AXV16480.1 hypothetical protein CYG48_12750 [Neorhizobium sp. SOG26]